MTILLNGNDLLSPDAVIAGFGKGPGHGLSHTVSVNRTAAQVIWAIRMAARQQGMADIPATGALVTVVPADIPPTVPADILRPDTVPPMVSRPELTGAMPRLTSSDCNWSRGA